ATMGGGAIASGGAATYVIERSVFRNNRASTYGGAVVAQGGQYQGAAPVTIIESIIEENTAGYHGGGLALTEGIMHVKSSLIRGNHATRDGGGIYANLYPFADSSIVNTTIDDNTSGGV